MKKIIFALLAISAISALLVFTFGADTKQVTVCKSDGFGADYGLRCDGDLSGSYTLLKLYKKGWRLISQTSSSYTTVTVFEK
ncbi:MAG: hypothetical protein LBT96_01300 [Campylobacteraceae bacterium]|jgi:hypothetical protein|nr:hypothetical protein [Campylobacteraceae bacterium]